MPEKPAGEKRAGRRRDATVVIVFLAWSALVMAVFLANTLEHLLDKLKEFHVL